MYETTIAYAPDALSTYVGPLWMPAQTGPEPDSLFKAINYTEFQEYQANTANAGYSKNLKIPSELAGIDPAWRTCTPGMYGSWDPPRVLTAAQNMVAPTAAQPAIAPLATAAPAAGIAPTDIPAAPTSTPNDPVTKVSGPQSDSADPSSTSEGLLSKGNSDLATSGTLKQDPPTASVNSEPVPEDPQSKGNSDPAAKEPLKQDPPSASADPNPVPEDPQSKSNNDPAAKEPLKQNPSSVSADPNPVSEGFQSKGDSDPALSIGQENASKKGNAGENQTPAPKQGQDSDPAKQQDGSKKSSPENTSPEVSSPAASGSDGENSDNEVGAPSLNVNAQGSQSSLKGSLLPTNSPLSPTPVIMASPTPLIVSGNTIQKATNGGVIIGTSTYTAGYEGIISNMPISVGVDSIVVGTTTHAFPTSTPVLIGGQSMLKAPNGGVVIGTSTYSPGSQAQVSGKVLFVAIGSVIVGGTTYAIPTPSTADTIFFNKSPLSRGPNGGAIVGDVTIGLGSQSSINGHVISVGASTVILDGTSYALPNSAGAVLQSSHSQSNSPVTLISGVFLTPGGNAATVSGTTYAIPSDDSGLVVNGQTISFPSQTKFQSVFTVAGQTFTAATTGFAIGGQSVALGGIAATVDGTVVSLGPSGVQIGSKTMALTSAQTTEGGLGELIMGGFGSGVQPGGTAGGTAGGGNGSRVVEFTGDSSRVGQRSGVVYFGIMVVTLWMIGLLV